MSDWSELHRQLSASSVSHRFRWPCSPVLMAEAAKQLGPMPRALRAMLHEFNGAELYIKHGVPMVTLFGLSTPADDALLDWFADRYTVTWRERMNRPRDWVIGITNFGGPIVLDEHEAVSEWDPAHPRWVEHPIPLGPWIKSVISRGEQYLLDD